MQFLTVVKASVDAGLFHEGFFPFFCGVQVGLLPRVYDLLLKKSRKTWVLGNWP